MLRPTLSIVALVLAITSCVEHDISSHGRLDYYKSGDLGSFVFSVGDDFFKSNSESSKDKNNPIISVAESDLLKVLMKKKGVCLDKYGDPQFKITAKQEKIYDATFAHLIEENYRARPLTPIVYSGRCLSK
jgi:hypothetical protein